MTISQRIFSILEEKKIKQKDLAVNVGISTSAISDWKKRGTNPAVENISAIADFLEVSLDFLITGKEKSSSADNMSDDERELLEKYKMLDEKDRIRVQERAETLLEVRKAEKPKPELIRRPYRRTRKIDFYEASVSAGTGVYLDNDYKCKIKIIATPDAEKADFALRISGNSMEPLYLDGDIVLVRAISAVDIDQIGVFIVDNEGYIKMFRGDRLCSLNEDYDDILFCENTELKCCGQVLGKLDEDEIIEM